MSSTDVERLDARLAETKAAYDKVRDFADLLYSQGLEFAAQMSTKYKVLLTDMHNLKDEHHRLSQELNAVKLNLQSQQIEELTAENQLLRGEHDSRASSIRFGAVGAERPSPEVPDAGRKRRRDSVDDDFLVKNISKVVRVEVPVRDASTESAADQEAPAFHVGVDVDVDVGDGDDDDDDDDDDDNDDDDGNGNGDSHIENKHQVSATRKRAASGTRVNTPFVLPTPPSASARGSSYFPHDALPVPSDVEIWMHKETRLLMPALDEAHTDQMWRTRGRRLQRHWDMQLKAFDDRNSAWQDLAAKVCTRDKGCVRSALFQPGKCNLTVEDPGMYACKTCWNTNAICVGWHEEHKVFFLRPQLPAARRSENNPNPGPFDVEMYESGNKTLVRRSMPKYWE